MLAQMPGLELRRCPGGLSAPEALRQASTLAAVRQRHRTRSAVARTLQPDERRSDAEC